MSGLFPKPHTRFLPECFERGRVWNWFIKFVRIPLLLIGALFVHSALVISGETKNGFDVTQHSVPLQDILSGGPPRDGIPAIMKPNFGLVDTVSFLQDNDRILGIVGEEEAKAYPIKIMNWHEIVNDTLEGNPIVVTYCPLCGTGIGFKGMIRGEIATFGVSGLLYQSDLLMYDHQSESLWSQIAMESVAGRLTGEKLEPVFLEHTTWGEWRHAHPQTLVLLNNTGYRRDYDRDPYLGYAQHAELMFPASDVDPRYHAKEWILGIEIKGTFKAYPFSELRKISGPVQDTVQGQTLTIRFNRSTQSAIALDDRGKTFPSFMAYWFAWTAFHPNTSVFSPTTP